MDGDLDTQRGKECHEGLPHLSNNGNFVLQQKLPNYLEPQKSDDSFTKLLSKSEELNYFEEERMSSFPLVANVCAIRKDNTCPHDANFKKCFIEKSDCQSHYEGKESKPSVSNSKHLITDILKDQSVCLEEGCSDKSSGLLHIESKKFHGFDEFDKIQAVSSKRKSTLDKVIHEEQALIETLENLIEENWRRKCFEQIIHEEEMDSSQEWSSIEGLFDDIEDF